MLYILLLLLSREIFNCIDAYIEVVFIKIKLVNNACMQVNPFSMCNLIANYLIT